MYSLLSQLDINFDCEIIFDWCRYNLNGNQKQGRYDFCFILNNNKYIIEMDGEFHIKDNHMNGQSKEESKYIDSIKEDLAVFHGFEVIRIDSLISDFNYIKKNILNSKLSLIFDLNIIDWNIIKSSIIKSRVIDACNLWNDGIHSVLNIAKIMKQGKNTVLRYLKQGKSIGLCDYNIETTRKNIGNTIRKKVICLNNGIVFDSCSDAGRTYNIDISSIAKCCKGKIDSTKGFIWRYADDPNQPKQTESA
jgi:hypothetical protein